MLRKTQELLKNAHDSFKELSYKVKNPEDFIMETFTKKFLECLALSKNMDTAFELVLIYEFIFQKHKKILKLINKYKDFWDSMHYTKPKYLQFKGSNNKTVYISDVHTNWKSADIIVPNFKKKIQFNYSHGSYQILIDGVPFEYTLKSADAHSSLNVYYNKKYVGKICENKDDEEEKAMLASADLPITFIEKNDKFYFYNKAYRDSHEIGKDKALDKDNLLAISDGTITANKGSIIVKIDFKKELDNRICLLIIMLAYCQPLLYKTLMEGTEVKKNHNIFTFLLLAAVFNKNRQ